jgi:hypothetical protein
MASFTPQQPGEQNHLMNGPKKYMSAMNTAMKNKIRTSLDSFRHSDVTE